MASTRASSTGGVALRSATCTRAAPVASSTGTSRTTTIGRGAVAPLPSAGVPPIVVTTGFAGTARATGLTSACALSTAGTATTAALAAGPTTAAATRAAAATTVFATAMSAATSIVWPAAAPPRAVCHQSAPSAQGAP
jgi:hypothetical protein